MMASAVKVSYDLSSSGDSSDEESPSDGVNITKLSAVDEPGSASDGAGSIGDSDNGENPGRGLANVMGNILKKAPSKSIPILAKATTDKERTLAKKRKAEEEIAAEKKKKSASDDEESSSDSDEEHLGVDQKRKLWEEMGRQKPSIMDKNREKQLQRIATKGVVQLFNAVRKQQKLIDDKLTSAGSSEVRRDKVMASMTKGKFMDVLKSSANVVTDSTTSIKKTAPPPEKDEPEENSSWAVLRDDFMMGAKMKDWDKEESSSDIDDQGPADGDGDSSDE